MQVFAVEILVNLSFISAARKNRKNTLFLIISNYETYILL